MDPDKFTLITAFSSERDQWMRSKCINIHDYQSPVYELTDEYDGRRALPKNFFMLLDSYQNHPEAKSLGPNGKPCEFDTRGLLQRAHIVANWPPIYIGKESDRHWEEGEDLSLLEFKAIEYRRKGKRGCGSRRTIGADRRSSQAGIHAPGNQSAHARENLQAGTCAGNQAGEVSESARSIRIGNDSSTN